MKKVAGIILAVAIISGSLIGCGGAEFEAGSVEIPRYVLTGAPVTISSATLTWTPPPTAYYRYIIWNGTTVCDRNNPKVGTGELVIFTVPQTILQGESIRLEFDFFKNAPTGGSNADVNNLDFTINLSDGSSFDISLGGCP